MNTRIPVYCREIAPGINFTTFSAEGTELLGWISGIEDRFLYPCESISGPGFTDDTRLLELSAEAALSYARAGMKGLKFESVHEDVIQEYARWVGIEMDGKASLIEVEMGTYKLGDNGFPEGPKDKDGRPIRFLMKPPTEVRFDTKELRDQVLNPEGPELAEEPVKTWRDRAIEKPLL